MPVACVKEHSEKQTKIYFNEVLSGIKQITIN